MHRIGDLESRPRWPARAMWRAALAASVAASALALTPLACSEFSSDATSVVVDGGGPGTPTLDGSADALAPDGTDGTVDASACHALIAGGLAATGWRLLGSAEYGSGGASVILTKAQENQAGLVSHELPMPRARSFRVSFLLRLLPAPNPADGVAFFWSSEAAPSVGAIGNDFGFCNGGPTGSAVTFVTKPDTSDAAAPFSSVEIRDNSESGCSGGLRAETAIFGTAPARIVIALDGPGQTITVTRDGQTIFDHRTLLGAPVDVVSVGFTGATGTELAEQIIEDVAIETCP